MTVFQVLHDTNLIAHRPGKPEHVDMYSSMKKEDYKDKLRNYMKKDAKDLGIGRRLWCQHGNDPQLTSMKSH